MKNWIFLLALALSLTSYSQNRVLDEKNGFQDIKLNSDVSLYPGLALKKKIKIRDVPDTELYMPKSGFYKDVGGIKIYKLEVIAYRGIVYEISIIAEKEPKFYKGLEKTYGEGVYSMKDNKYHWNGSKLNLDYQSHGKSKVRLKYHSLEVDILIKKDKVKEIEGIADDF